VRRTDSAEGSKPTQESRKSFDHQLAQAGAIANAQAQAQAPQANFMKTDAGLGTAATLGGGGSGAVPAEMGQAMLASQPKGALAHMAEAEYSPLTAKTAASVKTGSSIAGLKPWNQDWVFDGMDHGTSGAEGIRPLIGGSPTSIQDELAQMQAALKQLSESQADSGAAQVSNLRSMGDQGPSQAGPNTGEKEAMLAMQARLASQLPQQLAGKGTPNGLNQAMAQMNGQVLAQSSTGVQEANGKSPLASKDAKGGAASALSGSEFLKTLTLIRGNQNGVEPIGEDQNTADARGGLVSARPELKLIENSQEGKGKKSLSEYSSGDDFLLKSSALTAGGLATAQPANNAPAVQVTGHVVPGAMAQDQPSHDAIANVSSGIRNLGQGGGEMKIRLKPDGLGELHLKVMTQGNEVGLQIQASDEHAKKILQDSVNSLKEGLASHHLTLGKIEVAVAHTLGGDASNQQQGQQSGNGQQHSHQSSMMSPEYRDMMGQNAGQQNNGSSRWSDTSDDGFSGPRTRALRGASASARTAMAAAAGASSRSARMDGRLDVRA
jgi:flagellar hook-length control protein FliK